MNDFEVLRIEDKTLAKAVTELRDNYDRAKTLTYVNDPLAWALYQTWKEFDGKGPCPDETTRKGDYIKRDDALEIRVSCGLNEDGILYVPFRDVIKHLKNIPAADMRENGYADVQRDRWISVDDALPEESKKVLVANKRGKIFDIDKAHWDGRRFARSQKPYYLHVTHWMPLPKPPEVKET